MATNDRTENFNYETVAEGFRLYSDQLYRFIKARVNDIEDAADLLQDVFMRLLEYTGRILKDGLKSLAFAIAGNVVNDYLRHHYVKTAVHTMLYETGSELTNETEETVMGHDAQRLERRGLALMPGQRRLIYMMRIHEGRSNKEIAQRLNISTRTAENHFYIGIREMRACFQAAM